MYICVEKGVWTLLHAEENMLVVCLERLFGIVVRALAQVTKTSHSAKKKKQAQASE